jgi:glycosyltransferase involved in cell wall biosynthesis
VIRFLYVARAASHKGLSDLLPVLLALERSDWSLTIVGAIADEDEEVLRGATAAAGPRIILLGAQPLDRISVIMRGHDALVIPSRYENFCNAALEGLACGLPVIGVALGGIRDMVRPEVNGLLFRQADPADMALALCWALDRPVELAAMRPAAHATAKLYAWPVIAGLTSDALLGVVRARDRGDP